jgi:Big-like domain-containing protein/HYDIN/CFA65/VesB family protein/pectate lyase-like protein/immunoglobulin I-set domain protein
VMWQRNGSNILSGVNLVSYTTPPVTPASSGAKFGVAVYNCETAASAHSNTATLTVTTSSVIPTISLQPANQTVTTGQTASFSVAATGTAPLSYQWKKNGAVISGATSSGYTTPATTSSDNGAQFTVAVSNTVGSVTSSAATLTVTSIQLSVVPGSVSFGNVTVNTTNTQTIKLTNSGTANLTVSQATVSGSGFSISGLTLPATLGPGQSTNFNVAFAPANAGSMTGSVRVVSNATNSPATISLSGTGVSNTPPSVAITSPSNGTSVSGSITVSGTASDNVGVSSVQVQVDSGAFSSASGTTNWTFSLNTGSLSNAAHTLTARATNTSGLTASTTVSVNVSNTSGGSIVNVSSFGATGNGSTNDTAAINSAIATLSSGSTLFFPCGTYLTTSQLTLNKSNVTVDGGSCAVIRNTSSGTVMVIGGSGNGNPNYGSAIALSATANELATSFTTVSSLAVAPGDYLRLQQGGKDSSTGSGDTGCDPSGCRGEVLKVASVSGNTITVTTALHDTYSPSLNAAKAQKILSPLTSLTVKNITFDGNGSNVYGLEIAGVAESTVSGVTARNVQGAALLNRGDFNVAWNSITVTGAGSAQCGSAVWFENQGNLSINGMSISNENQGASGTGCLYNGAFGFELIASANSTITNLTVDAAGAYGRPFKTTAARYNTFNSPTVKNGVQAYNGISLEYYSSHNTYNSCVVTNNGAGTGTGTGNAGIITFGNFNQFNSFNNCTVSGNGNVQFYISGYDALRLAQDSHNTVSGGTFTGSNNAEAVLLVEGPSTYITGTTIKGPGPQGLYLSAPASNACVNNNTFMPSTGLSSAISVNSSGSLGLGNVFNLLTSNLSVGICALPLP